MTEVGFPSRAMVYSAFAKTADSALFMQNETDHRIGDQVQRRIPTVSDYRVRQMRDRGLRAIPAKLDKSP
jgi:hypothetical protein